MHLFVFKSIKDLNVTSEFFSEGWTLKPLVVNRGINLGTANGLRIDLAIFFCVFDIIAHLFTFAVTSLGHLPVKT